MSRLATIGVALAVLAFSGCGGGGTLSQEELQKEFEAIQSLAAEGALVADGHRIFINYGAIMQSGGRRRPSSPFTPST